MNFKEGMRRVALVAGFIGAMAALTVTASEYQQLSETRERSLAFLAVANRPVVINEMSILNASKTNASPEWDILSVELPPAVQEKEGIKKINLAKRSNRAEPIMVKSIERVDEEPVYPVATPSIWEYIPPLGLPIMGFLVMWIPLKVLGWVITGFINKHE